MPRADIRARLPIYEEMFRTEQKLPPQLLEDLTYLLDKFDEAEDLMDKLVASFSPADRKRIEAELAKD